MLAFLAAAAGPAMVAGFALSPSTMSARRGTAVSMAADKQRVLVIGGTRFSGLYLTKELHSRGHEVGCVLRVWKWRCMGLSSGLRVVRVVLVKEEVHRRGRWMI